MVGRDNKLGAVLGGATSRKIEEAFGYLTVADLLGHYPRTYLNRGQTSTAAEFVQGELVTVVVTVEGAGVHEYRDRRTGRPAYRVEVRARLESGRVMMTFFDKAAHRAKWRAGELRAGRQLLVAGKASYNTFKRSWELINPHYSEQDLSERSKLLPIYPAAGGVSSWALEESIAIVLSVVEDQTWPDLLSASIRKSERLPGHIQALRTIHAPDTWGQIEQARRRLRFDEALITQTVLAQRRQQQGQLVAVARPSRTDGLLDQFDQRLPFTLTQGQIAVGEEISTGLSAPHPMHRLLQGDVGSGKTLVALRAMLQVVDTGGQAALLAPTEVLAAQHHRSMTAMLGDLAGGGMLGGAEGATRVALLTGSMGAAARRQSLLEIASGEAGIVVGTHALLEDHVQFVDLGLVVVDEQHRFGVEQRARLAAAREKPPHLLVMTATPIPRTVAMTVFGDLQTSTLRELPVGRAPISSVVVPLAEQPAWWDRIWLRAREEVAKGHQVYVVCPRIGDNEPSGSAEEPDLGPPEGEDADGKRVLLGVEQVRDLIAERLPELSIGALHGRMPADAKDAAMTAFAAGRTSILVATTVIEVGVDVPNATMMVILDADRFGISQLHQLRGRVGRGNLPGLCLLVTHAEAGGPSRERLDIVAATTDGFELSLADLRARREGDVLGTSQSGRSSLRLLSVIDHEDEIVAARSWASTLVEQDPTLAGTPLLAETVRRLAESARADFLEKA